MSTRRARIKAVTSLPPRRKNTEGADNKNKPPPPKEEEEKVSKSPKTPRPINEDSVKYPVSKILSPVKSPHTLLTQNVDKLPQPIKVPTPVTEKCNTPKLSDKLLLNTSALSHNSNVFISPLAKASPRKHIPSPVIAAKTLENSQKLVIPDKGQASKKADESMKPKDNDAELKTSTNTTSNDNSKSIDRKDNQSDVPDDYNVPSVPESITEDAMDGIVPLQPACNAPKPIDLLKNEIISENAEVLFDPIVPLPSPSKVRPKLRPVPRLAPLRRNSVQGSASESEDESRRALLSGGSATPGPARQRHDSHTSHSTLHSALHSSRDVNRTRNDSVCSSVSQAAVLPPTAGSPVKEKHYTKTRRQELSRRMAAMRRRREAVKRDALTMYDLIFYNPMSNPFVPDQDELKAKEANEKEASSQVVQESKDEDADDPPAKDAAPVPQIKLGPNGEIILDEKSLVINQSNGNRKVSGVVREGAWGSGGGSYRRTPRTAEWSDAETVRFYRALAALGTDFTLMQPLFPDRTRRDLKLKFKREEKLNGNQVDKALRSTVQWDAVGLEKEFKEERAEATRRAQRNRDRLEREKQERVQVAKELRHRQCRSTKTLGTSILADKFCHDKVTTADEIIEHAVELKKQSRRKPAQAHVPLTHQKRTPIQQTPPQLATLTLINNSSSSERSRNSVTDLATLSKVDPNITKPMPQNLNPISAVPSNIETGSLVVLTVNDPNSPTKKMLQTYIAHGAGRLTPVNLPPTLLNSVVGYMKKGTPKSNASTRSSPSLTSPSSVASHDSRASVIHGATQGNSSPRKRQRHSSYTITPL